ncbi:hypothetical protein A2773_06620 [Candidatus Gottesmanbacteria bacterium RIFCSPHIGHO2_01_FULL_39_10]|uniref:Uncharacterized protein n=1 Tax=Candidatus Gottesmanbacteria bacterium RIFCSPHIGHO2_01_FULL_39_10 TaxID=1798375 RepID=A0A1F5ZPF4_9BACT|nr:MAG: hypothetical protein A2773_06620 [Candidatus Gottesmanbacteria bacterium RIFCSPHIGHO2_01_FULL_39_10]
MVARPKAAQTMPSRAEIAFQKNTSKKISYSFGTFLRLERILERGFLSFYFCGLVRFLLFLIDLSAEEILDKLCQSLLSYTS